MYTAPHLFRRTGNEVHIIVPRRRRGHPPVFWHFIRVSIWRRQRGLGAPVVWPCSESFLSHSLLGRRLFVDVYIYISTIHIYIYILLLLLLLSLLLLLL